jgi:uncharacterized protein
MIIIQQIISYITESFIHIWPFLLITIPISVAINVSGIGKKINFVFSQKPIISILLATLIGAFSPLCSCGVIPVIATLLISGVPLGPVMAFWLSSPSMDVEIFSLTVATLGWNLALWRLISTLVLSLSAGYITHALQTKGLLGANILKGKIENTSAFSSKSSQMLKKVKEWGALQFRFVAPKEEPIVEDEKCCEPEAPQLINIDFDNNSFDPANLPKSKSFQQKVLDETVKSSGMVMKFMLLAFSIGALMNVFMPVDLVSQWLGNNNPFAILSASLMGIPIYTSNLAAMPMVGELLAQGMNPSAALAFLIAGPITTIPAMSAVWGIVNKKVFSLYLSFGLFGAIFFGYGYSFLIN